MENFSHFMCADVLRTYCARRYNPSEIEREQSEKTDDPMLQNEDRDQVIRRQSELAIQLAMATRWE